MKKTICLALTALLLFGLCGCTVKVEQPKATENNTNSNTTGTTADQSDTTTPVADPVAGSNDLSREKVVWGP